MKTAEETLKDEISDYYWHILEDEITFPDHEKTLKLRIIEAMEAYAAQQVAEATKDCYPKEFLLWKEEAVGRRNKSGVYLYWEDHYTLNELFDYWLKNIKK
jgi:hypothetical protein